MLRLSMINETLTLKNIRFYLVNSFFIVNENIFQA